VADGLQSHFGLAQGRCHPLTILDDHSRYSLCLKACRDEQGDTVRPHLIETFERYGLPGELLCDNGPPWAAAGGRFTVLSAWLIRLGITVLHGRPFHPQTQGKDERFHQTLLAEAIRDHSFQDVGQAQQRFDPWRDVYNHERPHEALDLATPASRYRPSPRAYPAQLPKVEYRAHDRRAAGAGQRPRALCRPPVVRVGGPLPTSRLGLRPTPLDGRVRRVLLSPAGCGTRPDGTEWEIGHALGMCPHRRSGSVRSGQCLQPCLLCLRMGFVHLGPDANGRRWAAGELLEAVLLTQYLLRFLQIDPRLVTMFFQVDVASCRHRGG